MTAPEVLDPPVPTQVKRPWRTVARSVFQFVIALATLLPFLLGGVYNDLDQAPAVVVQLLAVAATITRVMAIPQVEDFLRRFFPFLAAQPTEKSAGRRRVELGATDARTIALIALAVAVVAILIVLFNVRVVA